MRKSIIIIIMSFWLLTSCQKNDRLGSYIGYTKADMVVDLSQQLPLLTLRIYTGINIINVKIVENSLVEETESACYDILLNRQGKTYPGFLYEINVKFKVLEFDVTHLKIVINQETYQLPFGTFKATIYDEHSSSLLYQSQMVDDRLIVEIDNKDIHNYYLVDTNYIYHMVSHKLTLLKVFDVIYREQMKTIEIGTIVLKQQYHMVAGLYKAIFTANLNEEILYIPYYYYYAPSLQELKEKGIAITELCPLS